MNGPQTAKELFNLRHAQLRNIIERVFGVIKKRFPILAHMHSFPIEFQVQIVLCCCMIHNFIRLNQDVDQEWNDWDPPVVEHPAHPEVNGGHQHNAAEYQHVHQWRDHIAITMWDSYVLEMQRRGIVMIHAAAF